MATECRVTRAQFRQHAKQILAVNIGGESVGGDHFAAVAKEFTTGSMGWNLNAKLPVTIDGHTVMCQVGLNITVIGSKELPKS